MTSSDGQGLWQIKFCLLCPLEDKKEAPKVHNSVDFVV